jgi:hypothetical protein
MTPPKHDLQCTTDCREDMLAKLSDCITMKGLWKFLGVFVVVILAILAATGSIYEVSQAGQNKQIEVSAAQIQINTLTLAEVKKDLTYLKEGQRKMEQEAKENLQIIIKEIRNGKR